MTEFAVKDSGERMEFDSGMVRDTEEGKTDYSLVLDGPMFKRWAEHLTKGAIKYAPRNWMKASGSEEEKRFKRSALRHFLQWYWGDRDEDHASAVFFNINGAEYCREQLDHDTRPVKSYDPDRPYDSGFFVEYNGPECGQCTNKGPDGWVCERPGGHSGDHAFPYEYYEAWTAEGSWPA